MVHHQTKAIHNEKEVSSSPKKSINAVIEKAQNAKDILHMWKKLGWLYQTKSEANTQLWLRKKIKHRSPNTGKVTVCAM